MFVCLSGWPLFPWAILLLLLHLSGTHPSSWPLPTASTRSPGTIFRGRTEGTEREREIEREERERERKGKQTKTHTQQGKVVTGSQGLIIHTVAQYHRHSSVSGRTSREARELRGDRRRNGRGRERPAARVWAHRRGHRAGLWPAGGAQEGLRRVRQGACDAWSENNPVRIRRFANFTLTGFANDILTCQLYFDDLSTIPWLVCQGYLDLPAILWQLANYTLTGLPSISWRFVNHIFFYLFFFLSEWCFNLWVSQSWLDFLAIKFGPGTTKKKGNFISIF